MPDLHHVIDVHVLITDRAGRLLLTRRAGNDRFAHRWHAVSGKVEHESVTEAAVREAWEEVGVRIDPAGLRLVHIAHVANSGPDPRIGFFFHATIWAGEPTNREPDKCEAVQWFSRDQLAELDIIEYPALGIEAFLAGTSGSYSESGWRPHPDSAACTLSDSIAAAVLTANAHPRPNSGTGQTQTFAPQPQNVPVDGPEP